jgi:hypothetical protein
LDVLTLLLALIGGLPATLSSATATELKNMVSAQLASSLLMGYYLAIRVGFTVVTILSVQMRFRSPSLRRGIRAFHAFFVNIGKSLLTAFRAALGALIGFTVIWACTDPRTMSVSKVFGTTCYASLAVSLCVMLAWMDEALRNPYAMSRYS